MADNVTKLFGKQVTPAEVMAGVDISKARGVIIIMLGEDETCSLAYSTLSLGSMAYASKVLEMELMDKIAADDD